MAAKPMQETANSRFLGTSAIERSEKAPAHAPEPGDHAEREHVDQDRPRADVLEVAPLGHELQATLVDRVDDAEGDEERRAELDGVTPEESPRLRYRCAAEPTRVAPY